MRLALTELTTLAVLAGAVFGTGQLLARAVGLRRLQWLDADSAAASALVGVAAWTIGFSLLSGIARLPARPALAVLATAHALALVGAWKRRTLEIPRIRGPARDWLLLGGATAATATFALLPVLSEGGFLASNDAHTYCALAEHLQRHGFGEAISGAVKGPPDAVAMQYQHWGLLLGASYPLALARAAGLATSTLALYPAVSALGLVLSVCGVWWTTRFGLRLGRPVAAATTFVFALTPHAAYWAHHHGFLSQTFAVPGLLLGLAALAGPRGVAGRVGWVTFSMAAAFLYIVYIPFLLLLAAGALVHAISDLTRARGEGQGHRALASWAAAIVLPLVLVGLDLTPLLRGLPFLLQATKVGGHVPLSPVGFAAIALGPGPGAIVGLPRELEPGANVLTLAAAILATIGFGALWGARRPGVLAVVAVLAALLIRYGFFVEDPWTGARGQTWAVFKTVQWAFPVALVLLAAGLGWLLRYRGGVMAVVFVAAVSLAPAHLPWSRALGRGLHGIVDGEQPLTGLENLLRRFRSLPSGQLFLLGLPERVSVFRAPYAALFAWPRTIITPAEDYADFFDAIGTGHVVPLLAQAPPFDREGRVDLGGGFARLTEVDRPRLVQVLARRRAVGESGSDGFVFPLARSRTKLVVLAPQRVVVEIRLDIEPAAGSDTSVVRCRIVQGSAGGVTFRRAVGRVPTRDLHVIRGSATLVRFEAERGLNAVVLNAVDRPQRLKGVFLRAALPQDGTAP